MESENQELWLLYFPNNSSNRLLARDTVYR